MTPTAKSCAPQVDIMTFKCTNSELGSIPQGIHPDTTKLDLSNNRIEILHEDSFLGFRQLQTLHLDDNRIYKITDRAFDALVLTLEYLSFRRNRLSLRVPSNFPVTALSKLKKLRGLDLSGNPLGKIVTEWFSPLGGTLHMLHISDLNGPVEIQKNAFAGLGLLEDFDLSNNEFSAFPENAFEGIRPEKLTAINLTHISWVCDCRLLWLRHWLAQVHLQPYAKEKQITSPCKYPKEFSRMTLLDLPVTTFQCVPKIQAINATAANVYAQTQTLLHVSSAAGETIQLRCTFLSQPKMLVSWYKNGVLLRPELKRIHQDTSKGTRFTTTLTIYDLQYDTDFGNYTCATVNSRGSAKAAFRLWISSRHKDSKFLLDEAERAEDELTIGNTASNADSQKKGMQSSWILLLATLFIGLCVFCGAALLLVALYYKHRSRCINIPIHTPLRGANAHAESVECPITSQRPEKSSPMNIGPTQIKNLEVKSFGFANGCAVPSEVTSVTVMPARPRRTSVYKPEKSRKISLQSTGVSSSLLFTPVGPQFSTPQNSSRTMKGLETYSSANFTNNTANLVNMPSPELTGSDKAFPSLPLTTQSPSFERGFEHEKPEENGRPVVRTFPPYFSYENNDNEDSDSLRERQYYKASYDTSDSGSSVSTDEACPVHGSRKHSMDKDSVQDEHFSPNWCPVHSSGDIIQESLKRTLSTASRHDSMSGKRSYGGKHCRPKGLSSSTQEITRPEIRTDIDFETAFSMNRWSTLQYSARKQQIHNNRKRQAQGLF
ncbi:unnamed protein product [Schistocephalus solidus]|uniref:Ig-like domain-containing protein n=1 Tax=Schistocephalus solidus TaxID=70667 RepID=A0A183SHI4_SCHSO|nr:unnamed protein product [Schistocephalus solidus]